MTCCYPPLPRTARNEGVKSLNNRGGILKCYEAIMGIWFEDPNVANILYFLDQLGGLLEYHCHVVSVL